MPNGKYCMGLDFGTLSGRAILVEVDTGNIIATHVKSYQHGVMDEYMPDGETRLGHNWALQHPSDYIEVLKAIIHGVIDSSGVDPVNVIGLSLDFTSTTMIPIDKDCTPLCLSDEFKNNPHSYPKLWKHHAAQPQTNKLNETAEVRGETFLKRYGGKIQSEWLIPKIMQVLDEAPEIYDAADKFIEAGDWLTSMLTGKEVRGGCAAGCKAIWSKRDGYPPNEFFKSLNPKLENLVDEKLSKNISPMGSKAGELTEKMAKLTGLPPAIAVGVPGIDAHVGVLGVGIIEPGRMMLIIGTSSCHMVLGAEEKIIPGICGVTEDGIIPGYLLYEAGQSCVGDQFDWFVKNCVPGPYMQDAKAREISVHKLLREKAKALKAGESGLLALDWWNGNRSILMDTDLTGLLIGCTLATKPEEIYRALIESTAFGTNLIIENFENNGIAIKEIIACGGIAEKDELLMQIYADVTNREIRVSASSQTSALGTAVFAAVAAGKENGGYDTLYEAAKKMAKLKDGYYKPISENVEVYKKLFAEYKELHDYFGKGENDVMKRLKKIKLKVRNY